MLSVLQFGAENVAMALLFVGLLSQSPAPWFFVPAFFCLSSISVSVLWSQYYENGNHTAGAILKVVVLVELWRLFIVRIVSGRDAPTQNVVLEFCDWNSPALTLTLILTAASYTSQIALMYDTENLFILQVVSLVLALATTASLCAWRCCSPETRTEFRLLPYFPVWCLLALRLVTLPPVWPLLMFSLRLLQFLVLLYVSNLVCVFLDSVFNRYRSVPEAWGEQIGFYCLTFSVLVIMVGSLLFFTLLCLVDATDRNEAFELLLEAVLVSGSSLAMCESCVLNKTRQSEDIVSRF